MASVAHPRSRACAGASLGPSPSVRFPDHGRPSLVGRLVCSSTARWFCCFSSAARIAQTAPRSETVFRSVRRGRACPFSSGQRSRGACASSPPLPLSPRGNWGRRRLTSWRARHCRSGGNKGCYAAAGGECRCRQCGRAGSGVVRLQPVRRPNIPARRGFSRREARLLPAVRTLEQEAATLVDLIVVTQPSATQKRRLPPSA
jgi:hypothetical protein